MTDSTMFCWLWGLCAVHRLWCMTQLAKTSRWVAVRSVLVAAVTKSATPSWNFLEKMVAIHQSHNWTDWAANVRTPTNLKGQTIKILAGWLATEQLLHIATSTELFHVHQIIHHVHQASMLSPSSQASNHCTRSMAEQPISKLWCSMMRFLHKRPLLLLATSCH